MPSSPLTKHSPLPSKGREAGGVRSSLLLTGRRPMPNPLTSRRTHPIPRRCPEHNQSGVRPSHPSERAVPGAACPLPPVAAFPHPVLHAYGAHPTDPPGRGYDSRLKDALLYGPARRLDVPDGSHRTRTTAPRGRRLRISRPRIPGAPPARPTRRAGSRPHPIARAPPGARGALTYPKAEKWPLREDRFVF